MAKGDAVHAAHLGPSQTRSLLGVIGTQGTADTSGTALTLPISVNKDTGAMYVYAVSRAENTYGTLGTTGVAVRGTLVPAVGVGTNLVVSGLSIVVDSGTVDCAIAFGTQAGPEGNDVLARGKFVAGGGIARDYGVPLNKTNGTLTYYMGGAGTAYFQAQYWDE